MKRSASQNKSRSRSFIRTPSTGLIDYLEKKYQKSIPVSAITAAHKLYTKSKALSKEDRFIKRFQGSNGEIDTQSFLGYLNKNEYLEKGKPLRVESIDRVYKNYANHDGKLSFDYIMKMAENSGCPIS